MFLSLIDLVFAVILYWRVVTLITLKFSQGFRNNVINGLQCFYRTLKSPFYSQDWIFTWISSLLGSDKRSLAPRRAFQSLFLKIGRLRVGPFRSFFLIIKLTLSYTPIPTPTTQSNQEKSTIYNSANTYIHF